MKRFKWIPCFSLFAAVACTSATQAQNPWLTYEGQDGPGKGKHIVLMAGDEEYRSEESMPQLAKILATHYGYKCTVLFSIDPATGLVSPNEHHNTPGLEALDSADLFIIGTRFRSPKDEQMAHIDKYLMSGKPVIGFRTATHAFRMGGTYARYSFNYKPTSGADKAWAQGFGRLVLGETWISHHGGHKSEGTRGVLAPDTQHPILNGLKDGDVWGSTDVYGVRLPLPGDAKPLVLGQVTQREPDADRSTMWFGMKPTDKPVAGKKNNPLMPVAWIKSYQLPGGGKKGSAFTTTLGASTDFAIEGTRRLLINAALFLTDVDVPENGANVDIVGDFNPTRFGFKKTQDYKGKPMKVSDFQ